MNEKKKNSVIGQMVLTALGLAVLGGAIYGAWYFKTHRPKAKRKNKPPTLRPMVEAIPLKTTEVTIAVEAMGTVTPAMEATVNAQVSGRITWRLNDFVEGGVITQGTEIFRLDDRDYVLATQQAEIGVVTATANLALEKGNQDVAKREWKMLGQEMDTTDADLELALRKPQLRTKEAELKLAKLRLDQAKLNQSRTSICVPFNAIVKSVDAQVGDLASAQTTLGRLIGTDTYWVQAVIPISQLKWVKMPTNGSPGAEAIVHQSDGVTRTGRVFKMLSDVETAGRMARVLIAVTDPLDLKRPVAQRRRPLLINEFVRVTIVGGNLRDVIAIDRSAYRDGAELWLLSREKTLRICKVSPVWSKKSTIYVKETFDPGYRLITSNLGYPLDGMKLRVVGEEDAKTSPKGEKKRTPKSTKQGK